MRESNALVFACAYAGKKAGDVGFFCAGAELLFGHAGWEDGMTRTAFSVLAYLTLCRFCF